MIVQNIHFFLPAGQAVLPAGVLPAFAPAAPVAAVVPPAALSLAVSPAAPPSALAPPAWVFDISACFLVSCIFYAIFSSFCASVRNSSSTMEAILSFMLCLGEIMMPGGRTLARSPIRQGRSGEQQVTSTQNLVGYSSLQQMTSMFSSLGSKSPILMKQGLSSRWVTSMGTLILLGLPGTYSFRQHLMRNPSGWKSLLQNMHLYSLPSTRTCRGVSGYSFCLDSLRIFLPSSTTSISSLTSPDILSITPGHLPCCLSFSMPSSGLRSQAQMTSLFWFSTELFRNMRRCCRKWMSPQCSMNGFAVYYAQKYLGTVPHRTGAIILRNRDGTNFSILEYKQQ